jgi:hypothetical protein
LGVLKLTVGIEAVMGVGEAGCEEVLRCGAAGEARREDAGSSLCR